MWDYKYYLHYTINGKQKRMGSDSILFLIAWAEDALKDGSYTSATISQYKNDPPTKSDIIIDHCETNGIPYTNIPMS